MCAIIPLLGTVLLGINRVSSLHAQLIYSQKQNVGTVSNEEITSNMTVPPSHLFMDKSESLDEMLPLSVLGLELGVVACSSREVEKQDAKVWTPFR